jgi:polar amino acid transport system substrate-binding protein
MKRIMICLALVLCMTVGVASTASADAMADIIKRGELRVAVQTQGPPFSFVNKDGKRTGSSVEFCRLMGEKMGVKVKFLDYDWDGLIPALLSGKADMLAGDMTANLKRATKVAFTDPFYYTGIGAVTKKGSKYTSLDQFNDPKVTIAILVGGTAEPVVKRLFPKATLKTYKGGGPMLLNAVMAGKVDIAVNDKAAIGGGMAAFPPNSMVMVPGTMSKEPLAFAVRPQDEHLRQWVNLFFEWIKSDGSYEENIKYWVDTKAWEKENM